MSGAWRVTRGAQVTARDASLVTTTAGSAMRIGVLRLVLLVRAAVAGAFAWCVATRHPQAASDLLAIFARYAAADAAVSVIQVAEMVGLGARSEYIGAALFGLVSRLCAALVIWFGPGISYFAVTLVLYLGLLATLVLLNGILELIEVRKSRRSPPALRTILTIEGAATIGIALLAFALTPVPATVRALMIAGGLLEAFSLLLIVVFGLPHRGDVRTVLRMSAQSRGTAERD